jgi:hypothetical protein
MQGINVEFRLTELGGDGAEVVHRESGKADIYYLRSSAMGGAIVAEIGATGQRLRAYAYLGGEVLAKYESGEMRWRHADPVTGSERWATVSGAAPAHTSTELDPLGVDAGVIDWGSLPTQQQVGTEFTALRYGDSLNFAVGCTDGSAPAVCPGNFQEIISSGGSGMFSEGRLSPLPQVAHSSWNTWLHDLWRDLSFDLGYGTFYGGSLLGSREREHQGRLMITLDEIYNSEGGDWQNPSSAFAPQNPLPGFDKGQLKVINQAMKEGAKLLKKNDCQKGLAATGINVSEVNRIFGLLSARPASDPSTKGYDIFHAEKSTDSQVQQFMQSEKGKGAGGFIYGQDILLRDAFFNARGESKIAPDVSRSLALIHEVVHLAGRGDAFFSGSSKLNDVVIHACWSKLYGHNDLSIVGN